MNNSELKKEMIVQYWHFSGMRNSFAIHEIIFAKVISFGKVFATVENERGIRFRIKISELEKSNEGEKFFKKFKADVERLTKNNNL